MREKDFVRIASPRFNTSVFSRRYSRASSSENVLGCRLQWQVTAHNLCLCNFISYIPCLSMALHSTKEILISNTQLSACDSEPCGGQHKFSKKNCQSFDHRFLGHATRSGHLQDHKRCRGSGLNTSHGCPFTCHCTLHTIIFLKFLFFYKTRLNKVM